MKRKSYLSPSTESRIFRPCGVVCVSPVAPIGGIGDPTDQGGN